MKYPVFIPLLIVGIFLCLIASYWQLSRAKEVTNYIDIINKNKSLPYVSGSDVQLLINNNKNPLVLQGKKINLNGKFNEQVFLLDNRVLDRQAGYDVLRVFESNNGHYFLVDTGWIKQLDSRLSLPKIPNIDDMHTLEASIYVVSKKPFVLAKTPIEKTNPSVIQVADITDLKKYLSIELFPYLIRLNSTHIVKGLNYRSHTSKISAVKNYGYALQWLAFALIAFIGIFILRRKSVN